MIFKLDFPERTEYAQAMNIDHLRKEYKKEYGGDSLFGSSINIISEDDAKNIILKDKNENKSFTLFDTVIGDSFCIVSSTDWNY